MSATLRYDIGVQLANDILGQEARILKELGDKEARRWAGVYRQRKKCHTFAVKLPKQVSQAFDLLKILQSFVFSTGVPSTVRNSAMVVLGKLRASLGLPAWLFYGDGWGTQHPEMPFLQAIQASPGDLTTWLVYADWLEEHGDASQCRRARVIRAWTGPKATKVKYGFIELAKAGTYICASDYGC